MHRKYFFFDIDGTLSIGQTMVMPESAVRCIERLRENGHFTALATGRLQASAAHFAAQHGFSDFVADGGLHCADRPAGGCGHPVGGHAGQ